MAKKHAKIEQLDGNVENFESDEESDKHDIAKDPNYEHRTYLTRKVSTAWISKDTPKWKNQILSFKPGYFLE